MGRDLAEERDEHQTCKQRKCDTKAANKYTYIKYPFSFVIKPDRLTNFTKLFCHETLYISDSSSLHHQEFIHCTLSNDICHTGL